MSFSLHYGKLGADALNRSTRGQSGQKLARVACSTEEAQAQQDLKAKAGADSRPTATQARGPAALGQGVEMSHSHELYRHGDTEQPPPFWYPPMAPGPERECRACAGAGGIYSNELGGQTCRDCFGRGHRRLLQAKCARVGCCEEAVWLHRCKTEKGVTKVAYLCDQHAQRIAAEKLAMPLGQHKNPSPSRQQFAPADIAREEQREREQDEKWAARLAGRDASSTEGEGHAQTSNQERTAEVQQLPARRAVESG